MKNILLLTIVAVVAGCGPNARTGLPSEENIVVDEAAVSAEIEAIDDQTEREAIRRAGLLTLNEAVKGFKVIHKRFPATLNEVVAEGMLHSLPDLPVGTIFDYNAETGEVSLKDLNLENVPAKAEEAKAEGIEL